MWNLRQNVPKNTTMLDNTTVSGMYTLMYTAVHYTQRLIYVQVTSAVVVAAALRRRLSSTVVYI